MKKTIKNNSSLVYISKRNNDIFRRVCHYFDEDSQTAYCGLEKDWSWWVKTNHKPNDLPLCGTCNIIEIRSGVSL